MSNLLTHTCNIIPAIDSDKMIETKNRVDQLIKPQGSLGVLESLVIQLSGIQSKLYPSVENKSLIVMCADHGVCEENVATGDPSVTLKQARNIPRGITGVGAIAKQNNTRIYSVDIGIKTEFSDGLIIDKKLMYGTYNIVKNTAMTREIAIMALEVGIEMAITAINDGADIIAVGEMGIGNTTPTTAILSVLANVSPFEITGAGANLPTHKLTHKASVIQRAIDFNAPNPKDPIDVLSKVGGLDIAGMAGVMIGCASLKTPVVIDGYISTVAALIAVAIEPKVKPYLIASHNSDEKGAKLATELLGITPYLNLNMRLGEGSGAVLALNIIESACFMNKEMITFEQADIAVV